MLFGVSGPKIEVAGLLLRVTSLYGYAQIIFYIVNKGNKASPIVGCA